MSEENSETSSLLRDSMVAQLLTERRTFEFKEMKSSSEKQPVEDSTEASGPMDLSRRNEALSSPPLLDPIPPPTVRQSNSPESQCPRIDPTADDNGGRPTLTADDKDILGQCKDADGIVKEILDGIVREMEWLSQLPPNRMYAADNRWRCQFCPFSGAAPRILHSHYQFHQQLLIGGSSSRSHMEWLSAYQRTRLPYQTTSAAMTQAHRDRDKDCNVSESSEDSHQSLRKLLSKSPELRQTTASGYLRSIVRDISPGQELGQQRNWPPLSALQYPESAPPRLSSATPASSTDRDTEQLLASGDAREEPVVSHVPIKIEPDSDHSVSEVETGSSSAVTDGESGSSTAGGGRCEARMSYPELRRAVGSPISVMAATSSKGCPSTFAGNAGRSTADCQYSLTGARLTTANPPGRFGNWPDRSHPFDRTSGRVYPSKHTRPVFDNGQHLKSLLGKRQHSNESAKQGPPRSPLLLSQAYQTPAAAPRVFPASSSRLICEPPPQENYSPPDTAPKALSDAGVQCELLSDRTTAQPERGAFSYVADAIESEISKGMLQEDDCGSSSSTLSPKCPHCGIQFDDEVLHSIHMGCHSHRDPFICNVCGKHCGNRYGFYTHIMRGHHQ